MKNKNINGFTLIELVVTISIVAVLGMIGFFSYNSHLPGVRDANRLSQMESLYSGLKIYGTKNNYVPLPDGKVSVSVNGEIYSYQGYAGNSVLSEIDFRKGGIDSKDGTYFTYYTNNNGKYFQILGYLEEEKNLYSFIPRAEASLEINYSNRYIKVIGNKLGVLTQSETNTPIQEIESIKTAGNIDLDTTTEIYNANFLDNHFIDGSGSILEQLDDLLVVGGIGCEFSGDLIKCPKKQITTSTLITLVDDAGAKRWSDGTSSFNCKNYLNASSPYSYSGSTGDGLYWIDLGGGNEIKVYCDMITDGGGWSLVLKADGNQTTFSYDELIWTNDSKLNEDTNFGFDNPGEYKNTLFSTLSFSEINLILETSSVKENLKINIGDNSLKDMFSGGYQSTNLGRDTWKGLISDSSLQLNCNKEGINSSYESGGSSSHSRIRIGILGNEQDHCESPDSRIGIGGEGSACGGNNNNSVGNTSSTCDPDNGYKDIKSFGYILIR